MFFNPARDIVSQISSETSAAKNDFGPRGKANETNFTSAPEYLIKLNSTISSGENKLNPIYIFLIKRSYL